MDQRLSERGASSSLSSNGRRTYNDSIGPCFGQNLCGPYISRYELVDLCLVQCSWFAVCFVERGLQLHIRRRFRVLVQKLGHLATRELQLRQTDCAARLCGADGGCKCFDGIPRISRIEHSVIVVFQIVSVDRDVTKADKACSTVRELCGTKIVIFSKTADSREERVARGDITLV